MAIQGNPEREAALLAAAADVMAAADFDPEQAALADEAADQAREAAIEAARTAPIATVTAPNSPGISLTFEQLKELMAVSQSQAPTYAQIAEMATKAAQAGADRIKTKELSIAETERKSPFNPLGDRDFPRPKLKCAMFLGAAPLGSPREVTVLTRPEIDALNALTPGHYRIQKLDRSRVVIEVKGQMNSNQQLDRLWILFPAGDEEKNLYPALDDLARACCDENRVNPGY